MLAVRDVAIALVLLGGLLAIAIVPALDRADRPNGLAGASGSAHVVASGRAPAKGSARTPAVPTPLPTAAAVALPPFPTSNAPLGLPLPSSCAVVDHYRLQDDLGAGWRIQCGSAAANLGIARDADGMGWTFRGGDRPDGMQWFSNGTFWLQIVYRRDGPAAADPVTIVEQYMGTSHGGEVNGADLPDGVTFSPLCAVMVPPSVAAPARKWVGRCGGDVKKGLDVLDDQLARDGWASLPAASTTYGIRRYCRKGVEAIVRWGGDLGAGVFALTQTAGAC